MEKNYFHLPVAFKNPDNSDNMPYPKDADLKDDTMFPELNSLTYNLEYKRQYQKPDGFLPFFCHLESSNDTFALATNNFNTCLFDASLIVSEGFAAIANQSIQEVSFQYPEEATITALKFLDSEYFLVAMKNSKIQLWNTRMLKQEATSGICWNKVSSGYGTSIAKLSNEVKFVLATDKGHLEVRDYDVGDNFSHSYPQAHALSITGVTAHPSSSKIFATCSSDRNCVLWDVNKSYKPALRILKNYEYYLTAVHWTTQEENKELLMVGDETGNILTIDPRNPNTILNKFRVEKRGVKKFCFNGTKRFGVVTRTKYSNFLEIADGEVKPLHKSSSSPGFVYSMCCDASDPNVFYVVGEEKYAEKIKLS